MKSIRIYVGILFTALSLQACNQQQPQQVQYVQPTASDISQQNQPQVVQQNEDEHMVRDGLIGAAAGYVLGRHTAGVGSVGGGYSPGNQLPTVVHNTTIVKKVYVQQNVKQVVRPTPVRTPPRFSPRVSSRRR